MKLIKIWCEWDVGQDGFMFVSKPVAREWCEQNKYLKDMCRDNECEVQDYVDDGMISFEELEVIGDAVILSQDRYDDLSEKEDWLCSLEAAGVDNWEGYDFAKEMHENDD